MNILLDDHKKILIQLLEVNVEFILIGGYAVIYHGYSRTTGDMDIWLKPTNENRDKLITVLETQGILKEDIDHIRYTDFTQTLAFHIDEPPRRVDFLTKMVGLTFQEADARKKLLPLGNMFVPVLHIDDLIVNKLLSGRAKDKADVEELQKIMRLKKQ
jgi:hypothetical protein